MRARDEFLIEVRWIINDSRDDEPGIAIRLCGAIVIFRHNRFFAVRSAVLSQVSRAHPARHNLQRTAGGRATSAPSAGRFPRCYRIPLPGPGSCWWLELAEMKEASLLAGVHFGLQRRIVFPRDMHASRNTHDGRSAVGFALLTRCLVFSRIPLIADANAFLV